MCRHKEREWIVQYWRTELTNWVQYKTSWLKTDVNWQTWTTALVISLFTIIVINLVASLRASDMYSCRLSTVTPKRTPSALDDPGCWGRNGSLHCIDGVVVGEVVELIARRVVVSVVVRVVWGVVWVVVSVVVDWGVDDGVDWTVAWLVVRVVVSGKVRLKVMYGVVFIGVVSSRVRVAEHAISIMEIMNRQKKPSKSKWADRVGHLKGTCYICCDEISQGQYRGYPSKCSLGQVKTKVEKKNERYEFLVCFCERE